jgi:uncharacterized protein (TIGR02246 family)
MDRAALLAWIAAYERAWRSPGVEALAELFAEDAVYLPAPFDEPLRGLEAIGRFWEGEREGPDEVFEVTVEPVALEGDTGVARLEVTYGDPPRRVYRDLWVVRLDQRGLCTAFEEWPFFPEQGRVAPGH